MNVVEVNQLIIKLVSVGYKNCHEHFPCILLRDDFLQQSYVFSEIIYAAQ
jgi:hypothetical protein